ncbi:MAG: hypothetical protein WC556_05235 [Candidatus Methanoperedens sp.]
MSIDFNALKVPANKTVKVSPILSTILVGKPSKTAFFQVRTGEGWEAIALYTYFPEGSSKDSQPYLVMPEQQGLLEEMKLLTPAKFYFYIIYGSNIMKIDLVSQKTNKNGDISRYHLTHMEALEAAKIQWVRLKADTEGGFYSYSLAEDTLPSPAWPTKPANIQEAIEIAFKGFVIDSDDHPELKKLRGKLL